MRRRLTRSNSIRSPTRFSLLLGEQVDVGDVQIQQMGDRPTSLNTNEASVTPKTAETTTTSLQNAPSDGLADISHDSTIVAQPTTCEMRSPISAFAATDDGFNNKPVDHADVATASTMDNQTEEDDFAHVATTNDALACRV
ncbi:hypothetical protein As57867_007453, partial [Aphanomyces stellatus]